MKPQSKVFAIAGVGLVLLLIGIVWYLKSFYIIQIQRKPGNDGGIACTTEAMLCPDGSSVGRVGPNCEFAACPSIAPIVSGIINDCVYEEKQCPDGSIVQRVQPNCEFAACPQNSGGSIGEGVVESPIDETQTELAQIPDGPLINNDSLFSVSTTSLFFLVDGSSSRFILTPSVLFT